MTDRELMQQALEALEYAADETKPEGLHGCECLICKTITALRERLAQPEQEPVAWANREELGNIKNFDGTIYANGGFDDAVPLYTTPPQCKPLTEREIGAILENINAFGTRLYTFARAIEAAHGIKP